jgi:hypothetical protein
MLEQSAKLDANGALICLGSLGLLSAVVKRDYFAAIGSVGVIITGSASFVDRRNRPLWWALVGVGLVLLAAGSYLKVENYQLSELLHDIFKP